MPFVIPDVLSKPDRPAAGSAGWADAAVIIPWTMYRMYGDTRVLEEQYPSMVKWVEYMRGRAGDDYIWSGDFHFGDWLAFATTRSDYPGATTGKDLIATAFYAHSTDLLARIGARARQDRRRRERTSATPGSDQGGVACGSTSRRLGASAKTRRPRTCSPCSSACCPMAISAGRQPQRLASEVEERKHLTTGFLGTPYLLHVLSLFRHDDDAYMLLERTEYPSWLYPVTKGRDDDLGALGRHQAGRLVPGRGDELVQSLRLRGRGRVDVLHDGRPRR